MTEKHIDFIPKKEIDKVYDRIRYQRRKLENIKSPSATQAQPHVSSDPSGTTEIDANTCLPDTTEMEKKPVKLETRKISKTARVAYSSTDMELISSELAHVINTTEPIVKNDFFRYLDSNQTLTRLSDKYTKYSLLVKMRTMRSNLMK